MNTKRGYFMTLGGLEALFLFFLGSLLVNRPTVLKPPITVGILEYYNARILDG